MLEIKDLLSEDSITAFRREAQQNHLGATECRQIVAAMIKAAKEIVLPRQQQMQSTFATNQNGLSSGTAESAALSANQLVTSADVDTGQRLIKTFRQFNPQALVFDEEVTKADTGPLSEYFGLFGDQTPRLSILIDGIDGTNNYVHGNTPPNGLGDGEFATMVSVDVAGGPTEKENFRQVAAFVLQPAINKLVVAIGNQGVWVNGEAIKGRSSDGGSLKDYTASYDFSFSCLGCFPSADEIPNAIVAAFMNARTVYANQVVCELARNPRFLSAFGRGHKPWDINPVALVAKQLGGTVVEIATGAPYHPVRSKDKAILVISSGSQKIVQSALELHRTHACNLG